MGKRIVFPRVFVLERHEDESGVSGTGIVAEGVQFSDGVAVIHWTSRFRGTTVYQNITEVEAVHGHGGKTKIVWRRPQKVKEQPPVTVLQSVPKL